MQLLQQQKYTLLLQCIDLAAKGTQQMQLLQQQKYTLYYFSDCNAQNLNK